MIGLTEKQAQCYRVLKSYSDNNLPMPTFSELQDRLGMRSKAQVSVVLTGLEKRGVIRRAFNRTRAIEIVDQTAVTLKPDVYKYFKDYAEQTRTTVDVAVNELLRECIEAGK